MQNLGGGHRGVHYKTGSAFLYIWKFIWLNIRKNYKSMSIAFKVSNVIPSTLYALTHSFCISLVTERGWLSTESTSSPQLHSCFLTSHVLTCGHMTELWPVDWEQKWWVPSQGLAHRNRSHLRLDGNIITLVP